MKSPFVSIITPCYNASRTIGATIESVLSQTFLDWELLIIDDCSSDNSAQIIQEYTIKDPRIKYYKTKKSSGSPSYPRNIGIDHANGEYIAFLDSDDLWLPNKLTCQVEFAQDNGYEFVYSDYEKISAEGKRNNRVIRMRPTSSYRDLLKTCSIPCLTAMLSKHQIGQIRFRNVPKEDYVFWLDVLKTGALAHNTGEVHGLYRVLPHSRSANKMTMIAEQWYVLRKIQGIKCIMAIYFMIHFMIHGLIKYMR